MSTLASKTESQTQLLMASLTPQRGRLCLQWTLGKCFKQLSTSSQPQTPQ